MGEINPVWKQAFDANRRAFHRAWISILGRTASFPREVVQPSLKAHDGRWYQEVPNIQEYLKLVEPMAPSMDVWVAPRPTTLYHLPYQHRPYFDIDAESLPEGLDRARALAHGIEDQFGTIPIGLFSANRGFHLHLEHEVVRATGFGYKEALIELVRPFEAFPDPAPLQNSRAMPRLPYSLNSKSIARHGEPLYVVPVDFSWSPEEILTAAREVRVRPFEIPYVDGLGEALEAPARAADALRASRADVPIQESVKQDLIKAAIVFTERHAKHLRGRRNNPEGIRRVLYKLYIPALVYDTKGDLKEIKRRCREYVEGAGGNWRNYESMVADTAHRCVLRDGRILLPQRIDRFLAQNADLKLSAKPTG